MLRPPKPSSAAFLTQTDWVFFRMPCLPCYWLPQALIKFFVRLSSVFPYPSLSLDLPVPLEFPVFPARPVILAAGILPVLRVIRDLRNQNPWKPPSHA